MLQILISAKEQPPSQMPFILKEKKSVKVEYVKLAYA